MTRITVLTVLAAMATAVRAAPVSWTGGGDGVNWNDNANWNVTPASGDTFTFPNTVTPGATNHNISSLNLASLTLNSTGSAGWTIGGNALNITGSNVAVTSSAGSTTLSSSGASQNTINSAVAFTTGTFGTPTTNGAVVNVAAGNTLRLTGGLTTNSTGAAPLRLAGGGTLWVSGGLTVNHSTANADAIILNTGTLRVDGTATIGGGSSNGVGLFGDSTLIWNSTSDFRRLVMRDTVGEKMVVSSADVARSWGTAGGQIAFVNGSGGSTGSLGFSVMGGTQREVGTTASTMGWDTANFSSSGTLRSATLKFNTHSLSDARVKFVSGISLAPNGTERTIEVGNVTGVPIDAEISGVIGNGTGTTATNLRKTGPGVLLLSANNTFSQGTYSVANGTLLLNGTNAVAGISVGGGATLGGSGAAGSALVSGAGTISPGNSAGILAVGSLNTSAGTDFLFELGVVGAPSYGTPSASGNDVLRVLSGGIGTLSSGNTITVSFATTPALDTTYFGGFFTAADHLASLAGATFSFVGLGGGQTVTVGTQFVSGAGFTTAQGGSGSGYITTFTVIPEPASLALAGLGGLMMLFRGRRKKA
jgi:fibronectin-binding autotransporter adhesin